MLVIPSLSEGLPNVLLEAMSYAVPVLATEVGAVPEVISDNKNGWLVEAGSVEALTEKLNRILNLDLEKMGKAAKESLYPKFSIEERIKKIMELYQ